MQIQMMYELNHTYMVVSGEEIEKCEDFRYKMLSANVIKGLLPLEFRRINNEKRIYIDVTGKESLLNLMNVRRAGTEDIKELFDSIYLISGEMQRFLIGETDVIMRPEMIFKNLTTGDYEFICIPLIEEENSLNEGMKALMHFLLMHINENDESLVNTMYQINDMYETGKPKFSLVYEFFVEETRVEEEEEEAPVEKEYEEKKFSLYIPGLKEILALALCISGIVLVGVNLYLSWL